MAWTLRFGSFGLVPPLACERRHFLQMTFSRISATSISATSAVLYTQAAWLGASVSAASAHGTSISPEFATLRPQKLGSVSKS